MIKEIYSKIRGSSVINTTNHLFDEIDKHFLASSKLKYPIIFTQSQRQVEGWFKGELLYLFSRLQDQGQLLSWESEAFLPNNGRKKSDFKVVINHAAIYLELKTLYTDKQGRSQIDLGIYFYKDTVGIWPDVQKLAAIEAGQGFCILFVYPSPNPMRWRQILEAYNTRVTSTFVREVSNIDKYPSSLYIAKLEILSN